MIFKVRNRVESKRSDRMKGMWYHIISNINTLTQTRQCMEQNSISGAGTNKKSREKYNENKRKTQAH